MASPGHEMAAPSARRNRSIDGLRAFAALAVVAAHVSFAFPGTPANSGWRFLATLLGTPAVWLFFMISGYVLYRPLAGARSRDRAPAGVAEWFRRRALRLVPAYWIVLALASVYPGMSGPFGTRWWAYWGLLQIYSFHTYNQGLPVAWSLCVEFSFYIFLQLWTLIWSTLSRRRWYRARLEIATLLMIGLASAGFRTGVLAPPHAGAGSPSMLTLLRGYSLLGQLLWFGLGMVLALVHSRWTTLAPPLLHRLLARPTAGLLALIVVPALGLWAMGFTSLALSFGGRWHYADLSAVMTTIGLVPLAFLVLSSSDGLIERALLRNRVIAWMGTVSYGIYLWHIPVLIAVTRMGNLGLGTVPRYVVWFVLTVCGATAVASLSYRFVERPFMASRRAPVAVPTVLA